MCGIVGCVGLDNGFTFLRQGLRRLEHRGYDSAGLAILQAGEIKLHRQVGRVDQLFATIPEPIEGSLGIAHTRWATHGQVILKNAHPQMSNDARLSVIHNGVIENHQELRKKLVDAGYQFQSDTDTEVVPLLLQHYLQENRTLEDALQIVLEQLEGAFGLVILDAQQPQKLFAVRYGSPLMIARHKKATLVASEGLAFHGYSEELIAMHDKEIAVLEEGDFHLYDFRWRTQSQHKVYQVKTDEDIERQGYEHFMLKEIVQQPQALKDVVAGRLEQESGSSVLSCLENIAEQLFSVQRVHFIACGTSYHAALLGARYFQELARLPSAVHIASELVSSNPIVLEGDLYIALSQSGETADTLVAVREIQRRGGKVFSICNQVGSSLAQLCGSGTYLHVGKEISVASTKTFSAQLLILLLMALRFARLRHYSLIEGRKLLQGIEKLPEQIEAVLTKKEAIEGIVCELLTVQGVAFIGRGSGYPLALEGALKLKELAYLAAEGYPGGEIKHGPLARISEAVPTVALIADDGLAHKMLTNIAEVRARQGKVVIVSSIQGTEVVKNSDYLIQLESSNPLLAPFTQVVALQLFAYYFAKNLGYDVDHPRNLAKSVTVE